MSVTLLLNMYMSGIQQTEGPSETLPQSVSVSDCCLCDIALIITTHRMVTPRESWPRLDKLGV